MSKLLLSIFLFISIHTFSKPANQSTVNDSITALSSKIRIEGIHLGRESLHYQALEKFQHYLELQKKIKGEESYSLGGGYRNIGISYKNLGQLNLALTNFKLAEKSYLLKGDPNIVSIARLYRNIGNVYRAKLDYTNALNYFERALSIFLNQEEIDPYDISDAHYAIAEINYLIGKDELAIEILSANINEADQYTQIYFNELLALINLNLENIDHALFYFQEALNLTNIIFENTDMELAIQYMNFSEFLYSVGRFDDSLENLQNAYEIISASQPTRGEQLSRYYEILGSINRNHLIESQQVTRFKFYKRKNLNTAINWYEKGLNALSKSKNDININTFKIQDCLSFLDCLALLQQIGDTYYELALIDKDENFDVVKKSLESSLKYYQAASRLTEQARKEISSDESKIQLAELEHYTFTKTIETAYLAYEATNNKKYLELAFSNSEQLKSSSVFDKLSDDLAQENSLIPDSLIQYEKKLNSTISVYNQKIFDENNFEKSDSALIEEYNKKIFVATRERDELNRMLEEEYPDYYNLKYSNSMLSIDEIQRRMDKNEAILEYVIVDQEEKQTSEDKVTTESYLFTILITQNNQVFHKSIIDTTFQNSLDNVFSFMSNPAYLFTKNDDSKEFCIASHNLYNVLIAPFEKELINKNLVFIPDGKLNYISFDGLLQNLPDTGKLINFSELDYLIKQYNINYANSVNILFQNKNLQQTIKNSTLAFAPKYDSEQFELSNASYTLMPLPGVQKEVDAIAKTLKTQIFRGEDASEENFRKYCSDYDILHLAMHAYINDSLPAFSRLAFSPHTKDSTLNKDGWLNTTDIYNLELNARLAVLSACNTGVGKLQKGEGMMSLARGFLYAGCPSIIMSLWEVEDESGTEIMSSFYKNLKKGKTKDEALRLAKLSYLKNSNSRLAHPHYWLSFKSIGDNSPIYTSYDIYFFAVLIVLILAFTIDQTLRIRKARKRK